MKIAILTFHRANNCGAMLQSWALRVALENMGHHVEFPCCNDVGNCFDWAVSHIPLEKKGWQRLRSWIGRICIDINQMLDKIRYGRFYLRFRKRYLMERMCKEEEIPLNYDCVIIGSDQVWNPSLTREWTSLFLGEVWPKNFPKIAYAASLGDEPLVDSQMRRIRKAIVSFKAVSVREPFLSDCLDSDEKHVEVVCDPTLLISDSEYESIAAGNVPKKNYIYMYCMYLSKFEYEMACGLAKRLKCDLVITPVYLTPRNRLLPYVVPGVSPAWMVKLIKHAAYVIGSSFHGTAISIICHKRFISLRNVVDKYESRQAAVLNRIGLGDRVITPQTKIEDALEIIKKPFPDSAAQELESYRRESISFIKRALATIH